MRPHVRRPGLRACLLAAGAAITIMASTIGATFAGVGVAGAATGSTILAPTGGPGAPPGPSASLTTWQAWAQRQRQAMESTTWAAQIAAQGGRLVSVDYEPVTGVPGSMVPAGVTTMATVLTFDTSSTASATSTPSPSITAAALTGNCAGITDGTACVSGSAYTGGYLVDASYVYGSTGTINGHVELGVGGCRGSGVKNGPNVTFTYGTEQEVVYGPVYYTDEWSLTFWRYTGVYSDWGSACATL